MANLTLPGNPRYQPKELVDIFGYDNLFRALAEVELAVFDELAARDIIPAADYVLLTAEMRERVLAIQTTSVDEVERKVTKHDVRAWVRLAQEILPPVLRRWVHVPLTSYDALDTARALQFKRAHDQVIQPMLRGLLEQFGLRISENLSVLQIGRTHGQHALPITVGFWLATCAHRIATCAKELERAAASLRGKISGAVGAKNAQWGLKIERLSHDPFDRQVLARIGLQPAVITTQILPPEPLANYLFQCVLLGQAIAQFADDCRHLMRTEIAEVGEEFEEGQVGSSTMAGKRNPVTFETLIATATKMLAEFLKVMLTLRSEHQRDLTGSAVARDFPTIVVDLVHQLATLLKSGGKSGKPFIARISIDVAACRANFERKQHIVLAEPMYIALQMAGYEGDAHELVNHTLVPISEREQIPLIEAAKRAAADDPALQTALSAIPADVAELLHHPERYTGDTAGPCADVLGLISEYIGA